jgi:iron complex outermembrane receptor protein
LIHISPGLFWRKNTDDYLLDRDNPQLYHNYHETNSYGGELQTEIYSSLGISVLSAEISRENIQSTNLGDHQRDKTGLYFEQQFLTTFPVHLSLGFSSFYYSDWGWQTWPGIEISWQIFQTTTLFASYNQAFRVPTFTELYYQSPTDYGNPGLHPEESKELEIGFNSRFDRLSIASSVFRREAENLIDWLRINESEPWQAMNLTEIATDGFEIIAGYSFDQKMNPGVIRQIQTSYTWLSSDADAAGYETKYVLNYLKHQFLANIQHGLIIPDLSAGWNIRYEQRENAGDYWLVDLKMTYTIKPFLFYAEATNLFNQSYESVAAVPMPGRWIKAGFNYHFPFDMTK